MKSMKILEATEKDSRVLVQMATKIWDNENVDELEQEFIEIYHSTKIIVLLHLTLNFLLGLLMSAFDLIMSKELKAHLWDTWKEYL